MTLHEIRKSPKMKAHAFMVIHSLGAWVENLEKGDMLKELVRRNSVSHEARGMTDSEPIHVSSSSLL